MKVLVLQWCEFIVVREQVLLLIKSVQNDSDEEVKNEQGTEDEEGDEECDKLGMLMPRRNLMDGCGVNGLPHDTVPPFCRHHGEHGKHGRAHIVKVSL